MSENAGSNWEKAWQLIADIRDRYPRAAEDAPTDEIVDALVEAGLITAGNYFGGGSRFGEMPNVRLRCGACLTEQK